MLAETWRSAFPRLVPQELLVAGAWPKTPLPSLQQSHLGAAGTAAWRWHLRDVRPRQRERCSSVSPTPAADSRAAAARSSALLGWGRAPAQNVWVGGGQEGDTESSGAGRWLSASDCASSWEFFFLKAKRFSLAFVAVRGD